MSENKYRDQRKIDPTAGSYLADGSPNNDDRIEMATINAACR